MCPAIAADVAEARKAARRNRLLDAAGKILGEEGYDALSVRRLAAEARVGPRFVYESFADVHDVAVAAYERALHRFLEAGVDAMATGDADPRSQIRAAIAGTVDLLVDRPQDARILLSTAPQLLEQRQRGLSILSSVTARHAFALREAEPGGPALAHAVGVFVAQGSADLLIQFLDGNLPYGRAALIDLIVNTSILLARDLPNIA